MKLENLGQNKACIGGEGDDLEEETFDDVFS